MAAPTLEDVGRALALPRLPRSRKNEVWADPKAALGDVLVAVPDEEREAFMAQCSERFGVALGLLQKYVRWAEKWPPSERTVPAAWAVYEALSPLPLARRRALLRPYMTFRQAVTARADAEGSAEEKADRIIALMDDDAARKLVMDEVAGSRVVRKKVRDAAKLAASERRAARRLIEAKLREAQNDYDRSYWEFRLHLVEEMAKVQSVTKLHRAGGTGLAPDPDMAALLRELGAVCADMADSVEGIEASAMDAEAWEDIEDAEVLELGEGSGGG